MLQSHAFNSGTFIEITHRAYKNAGRTNSPGITCSCFLVSLDFLLRIKHLVLIFTVIFSLR
jgi:hypothetical protein